MKNKYDEQAGIMKPATQLLTAKANDTAFLCLKKRCAVFTDFTDPKSLKTMVGTAMFIEGVSAMSFGGGELCERKIVCFYPSENGESSVSDADFPIKTLFIDSSKFVTKLTHRDFLGSIIGLGLDRRKVGDIFVTNGNATVFVKTEIADFLVTSLTSVGRVKTKVSELSSGFIPPEAEGRIIRATVSSMRLDAVLGEAFRLSRSKSQDLIRAEKAYLNWSLAQSVSATVKEGDTMSARGFGRAVVKTVGGTSKKGRIVIELEVF